MELMEMETVGEMSGHDDAGLYVLQSVAIPTTYRSSSSDEDECISERVPLIRKTQPSDISPQRISATLLNLLKVDDYSTNNITQDLQYIFDCVDGVSDMNTEFDWACLESLEAHLPELFQVIYRQCFDIFSVSPTFDKSATMINMQLIGNALWTGTDKSEVMCQKVLMIELAADIFTYLDDVRFHSPSQLPVFVVKKCIRPLLCILHNTVQMCREAILVFRKARAIDTLLRFCTLKDFAERCVVNFLLAHIIPENENKKFNTNNENIAFVVQMLRDVCEKPMSRSYGFSVQELLSGINKLAINDANKKYLVKNNILHLYTRLMRSDSLTEQRLAAEGVWELSFTNKDDIAEEEGCLEALHDLASSERLRQVALMALHNVEGGGRQLTVSMGRVALHNLTKEKKVFISYEKSTEMLVLEIAAKLVSAGFYVCKDENNSSNEPSLFAQLYANDISPCSVLIAASRKYQDSLKCRQEATYAMTLACRQKSAVNIVPIIAKEGYTLDGWLHYVFMNFPCTIDFILNTKFESNVSELIVALSKKDISIFIRTHVKHRTCCRFIRDDTATGDMCFCGRKKDKHEDHIAAAMDQPDGNDGSVVPWDVEHHTTQIEASCFGTVKFIGFGSEVTQEAPYTRVDHRTGMETIWTMMRKYWNMPPPKLIISVIGGERDFHMSRQLRSSFKRGLVSAATSAGAWVISGGSHGGVSGLVGEAFREYVPSTFDHEPVALGITGWGVIDNNLSLMSHNGDGLFPATYSVSPAWHRPLGKVPLDHNHTHFLLVDNGTERQFDTELHFRSKLENYLADSLTRSHDDHVPVVLLVLEGGLDTLRRVAEAVETGTLVVVIAGSGRAADLIASALSKAKSTSELVTVDEEFCGEICRMFNWPMSTASSATTVTAEGELSKSVAYLNRILEHKSLVTVYTPHDYTEPIDIDYVILEALAEGTKFNPVSQLQLALDWNRSDIAAKHIFNIVNSGNREEMKLERMMFTALMQNQVDFVKLFIDSGFDLTKFLTVNRLDQLYEAMLHDGSVAKVDLFRHLLERVQSFRTKLHRPRPDTYSLTNVGKVINFLLRVEAGSVYDENSRAKFACPERELMYWALLFDRQELAIFLWSHCPDPLGAALTAGALLTSLAKQSNNDEKMHMSNDLRTHASEFEELAVGVLDECHNSNTQLSHRLLVRRLHMWSNKTPLMIARGAYQMSFMEHACVQTKLNRLWMGNMSVNTSVWKVIFLLLPFIKFSSSELGDNRARRLKWHASSSDPDSTDGLPGRLAQATVYFVSAPVTKFYFHTVSFIMFMTLFSYVVMTNLRPTSEEGSPAISEYVLWGCGVTLVVEEARQAFSTTSDYLHSSWNQLDLIAYSTLILSVILRYTVPDSHFSVARMTYCVALVVFYLRFLQVFFINKNIGPKVIIVRRMVTDVMFFMCILLVFMVSYGTVSQALRYPNSPLSWSLLRDVISYPFWFIHGQYNQEEMEGNVGECTSSPEVSSASHGLPRCPETSWLLVPISGAYLVIANILLLNLLIAMFSNTFQNVQDKSETLWRYYLYDLIYEYFDKPALPPPLIIFSHLHRVWKFAAKRLCQTCKRKDGPEVCGNAFCCNFSTPVNNELTKFERHATEKYLLKKRQIHNEHINTKVQLTRERIDKMAADLEDIKERMKSPVNLPTVQSRPLVEQYELPARHAGLQSSMHNAI